MDAKFRARDSSDPVAAAPGLVQDAVTKWFSARAERCGFSFGSDEVTVDGYHQLRFSKGHGQPDIRITVVDVGGLLTVIDPVRFLDMLRSGLGHAKGFGCGLMLIRRV
jgi:CRISPR system Cascade subunit CasE